MSSSAPPEPLAADPPAPVRLASLDLFRGLVMFLLLAEQFKLREVATATQSGFWSFLAAQQEHVAWAGSVVHDIIQPGFSFLVGAALAFSVSNRRASQQPEWEIWLHAFLRAVTLVLLGIFLRSLGKPITNFTFEDTLTQIGLGYFFLFLLARTPALVQWIALGAILTGYWLLFALFPAPGPEFDYTKVGVPANWPEHFTGFASHWNKNSNAAWAFDTWLLNLFPRVEPFLYNRGGYATLSFIPTLGTMLLGLRAGEVLREEKSDSKRGDWEQGDATNKLRTLVLVGSGLIAAGLLLHLLGINPLVKRIWTPSWTLFSGGVCFLLTAGFYWVADVRGWQAWGLPLAVLGMNSIAAYILEWIAPDWLRENLVRHLGQGWLQIFGAAYEPLVTGVLVVLLVWLFLFYLYRQKVFLRI